MAKLNTSIAGSGRAPRSRPSMTPSQFRAYLLARETLRRLTRAASSSNSHSMEARK